MRTGISPKHYKVWIDNDEAWDVDDVNKPTVEIDVDGDHSDAAIAARATITGRYFGHLKYIVLGETGPLTSVTLEMRPWVVGVHAVTIEELRDEPAPVATRESKGGRR